MNNLLFSLCLFALPLFSFQILPECPLTSTFGYGDWYFETDGELSLLKRLLKPGWVVLDAGANKGEWSLCALQVEPSIALTAFEPLPKVFEELQSSLASYKNANACNIALSNTFGESSFHYYDDTPDHSSLSGFYYREVLRGDLPEPSLIQVPLDTLAHFCEKSGVKTIDFLKIDTEGAEWNILQGASELIRNHQIHIIQFEYGGCYVDAKTTLQQIYRFLTENNYWVFRIIPDGLIHIYQWQDDLENFELSNYCAIDKEKFSQYFPSNMGMDIGGNWVVSYLPENN